MSAMDPPFRRPMPPAMWQHFTVLKAQREGNDGYCTCECALDGWGVWGTGTQKTLARVGDRLSLLWHGSPAWPIRAKVLGEKLIWRDEEWFARQKQAEVAAWEMEAYASDHR